VSIRQISRFAFVGALATLVHIWIGTTLIGKNHEPLAANLAAFFGAFGFSFLGHRYYSFQSGSVGLKTSFSRYVVIAISGFSVNTLLLAGLLNFFRNNAAYCLTASTAISALVVYYLARTWAFRGANTPKSVSEYID